MKKIIYILIVLFFFNNKASAETGDVDLCIGRANIGDEPTILLSNKAKDKNCKSIRRTGGFFVKELTYEELRVNNPRINICYRPDYQTVFAVKTVERPGRYETQTNQKCNQVFSDAKLLKHIGQNKFVYLKNTTTVAKKSKSNHTKEDLRYTLLTYGLKIDNDKFNFKFKNDESGLLISKRYNWSAFPKNPDGSYKRDSQGGVLPGKYTEEKTEDKIFWSVENNNKFSFRKIGRDKKNFVLLDFNKGVAKVNLDNVEFKGKIWTPQKIVTKNNDGNKIVKKPEIKKKPEVVKKPEKSKIKKPKEKIIAKPDIDSSLITIGSGSGFYINNKGHALTNNHVIDICKQSIAVIDGKETLFRVIATDKTNDVAVLKTDYRSRNFIKINEDGAKLGENVIAVGYPLAGRLSDSVKITRGIVSSLSGLNNNIGQIQIDAALQPGNSGGPVLNENGELVGIASAGLNKLLMAKEAKYIPENVNFAVASPIVVNILKSKKVKYTAPGMFSGSFSNTELAELGDSSTIQLFCRNTKAEYARLKKSKKYSQILLDID